MFLNSNHTDSMLFHIPVVSLFGEGKLRPMGTLLRPYSYVQDFNGNVVYTGGSVKDVFKKIGSFFRSAGQKLKPFVKALAPIAKDLALQYGPQAIDFATNKALEKVNSKESNLFGKTQQSKDINSKIVSSGSQALKNLLKKEQDKVKAQRAKVSLSSSEASKLINGSGILQPYQSGRGARGGLRLGRNSPSKVDPDQYLMNLLEKSRSRTHKKPATKSKKPKKARKTKGSGLRTF